ncbi:MAG: hypothetical protein ACRD0U_07800 [Acidimicrobiales bacterium]
MTPLLVRLAIKTSWGGRRTDRRRALLIAVSAAGATLILCGVLGAFFMVQRVTERSIGRAFPLAAEGEAPALTQKVISDSAPNGDQMYVVWYDLLDPTVRVRGVPPDPPDDSWFVSPALAERMEESRSLRQRFPGATEIAPEGVGNPSELLAYRFVDGERLLLPNALSNRTADEPLIEAGDLEALSVVRTALILFTVPIIGLLLAAMAFAAPDLDQRLGVLDALGASRHRRAHLVTLHAALSAGPGALLAGGLATWVLQRRTSVPFVGRRVLRGDLGIPLWAGAACVVAVVATTAVVAVVRPRSTAGNRPTARIVAIPRGRSVVPLVVGLVMMIVGSGVVGEENARVFVAGLIASSVAVVVALPFLFRHVGNALASMSGVLGLLAGRRLSRNGSVSARALLALGALAALTPVAAGWIDLARDRGADNDVAAVAPVVGISGPVSGDERDAILRDIDAVPLEVVTDPAFVPTATVSAPPQVLVGHCRELGRLLEFSRCDDSGFALTGAYAEDLGHHRFPVEGASTAPEGYTVTATLFPSSDWETTDAALRAHIANRTQPGYPVLSTVNEQHESPLVRWLLGGITLAAIISAAALGLHVVAHSARIASSRAHLAYLGASQRVIRRVVSAESVLTVAIAGLACTGVGSAGSWFFVQLNPDADFPIGAISALSTGILGAALLAGAASWRSVSGEPGATRD